MPELPTGVVTFLFTDVEGSTQLAESYPAPTKRALKRHDELIEQCVSQNYGVVVRPRGEGDSRFAVFVQPSWALAAAAAIQRALAREPWTESVRIRVRIALHTGEANVLLDDYYGVEVNRCARLRSIGYGGQTLVSGTTRELVWRALPAGLHLRDMGWHRLKDLMHPEHVFQLDIPELQQEFPPLKSLDNHPNNLPNWLPPFVGRTREIRELAALLKQPRRRLLVLTGMGGIGKTRLALQVAAEVSDDFSGGVFWVDLAPIAEAELVLPTIARVFGLGELPEQSLFAQIAAYLRDKKLLLLLDNFERVIQAAPLLSSLLNAAPELWLLVTSQVAISVPGRSLYDVPPLDLPAAGQRTFEAVVQNPAIELFVQYAQASRNTFRLTAANLPKVIAICRRLDGVPLAIELIAVRVAALDLDQLDRRLIQLLRDGGTGEQVEPRRVLWQTIELSYTALDATARTVFARLALFLGGCTLSAAEAVCAFDRPGDDIVRQIDTLVAHSMLRSTDGPDGYRYVMLEPLREYAGKQLAASGDLPELQRRHAQYFLEQVELAEPKIEGRDEQPAALRALDQDYGNIRAALLWASEHRATEMFLRLIGALWRFWYIRGDREMKEGRRWLETALASIENDWDSDPAASNASPDRLGIWARVLNGAGGLAFARGEYQQAQQFFEESLSLRTEQRDTRGIATALNNLGTIVGLRGDYQRAQELFTEARTLFQQLGDQLNEARVCNNLGELAARRSDTALAGELFAQSLQMHEREHDDWGIATSLVNLGDLTLGSDDNSAACARYLASIPKACASGDMEIVARALEGLGAIAANRQQYDLAGRLWGKAAALRRECEVPLPERDHEQHQQRVAAARASYDGDWQAAWVAGEHTPIDDLYGDAMAM